MKCPKCQHENPEDARFCNGCGHGFELACPECKKPKPFLAQSYFSLGELYNDMGRKEEALKYLKKTEAMFKEMEMDYDLAKTHEVLRRV